MSQTNSHGYALPLTPGQVIGEARLSRRKAPMPLGPGMPLPDDSGLLCKLLADMDWFISAAEAFTNFHNNIAYGSRISTPADRRVIGEYLAQIGEYLAEIDEAVLAYIDAAERYFPDPSHDLRLIMDYIRETPRGWDNAEEFLANEGLLAAITWLRVHARNARSVVFEKLRTAGDSGWLSGTRSQLTRAMGMTGNYSRYLEKCQAAGELDLERIAVRKFKIRLKDPRRHREVAAKLEEILGE
jgi:hypothetical protein